MVAGTFSALSERVANLTKELEALEEEVRALRRILLVGTITVACSALTFSLTVLAGTGKI
jgi:hypothetical protein